MAKIIIFLVSVKLELGNTVLDIPPSIGPTEELDTLSVNVESAKQRQIIIQA